MDESASPHRDEQPVRHIPPHGDSEESGGCGGCLVNALVGAATWVVTFVLLFVLSARVVGLILIGDRCEGKAAETMCGFEILPISAVIALVGATVASVIAMRGSARRIANRP